MSKKWRYIAVIAVVAAIAGCLMLLAAPSPTLADGGGGVGGGGSGSGGAGGAQSGFGWGWARYDISSGGAGIDGPSHEPFRNGIYWTTILAKCSGAQAPYVDVFIINWSDGGGQGYNYQSDMAGPPEDPGHFTTDNISSVDHGKAKAISTSTAKDDFDATIALLKKNNQDVSGYHFGQNVAWFCYNPNPSPQPSISCQVTNPDGGATIPVNTDTTVKVKAKNDNGDWPNGYYLKRTGSDDSETNYVKLTNGKTNGSSFTAQDTVHPPPGPATVTYTYQAYDNNDNSTGKNCKVTYKLGTSTLDLGCDTSRATFPAGTTQIYVQWQDSSGANVGSLYSYPVPSTSPATTSKTWDTFNTFTWLLPHNAYSAELFIGSSGGTPAATDLLPICLDGACGSQPVVDGEIGQTQPVNYVFNLDNETLKPFNSGYSATITTTGGISVVGANTVPVKVATGINDVTVTFKIVNNYDGDFSVQFNYNNAPISLATWGGTCGPIDTEAVAMPYFQVWNGDISAGGGFGDALPGDANPADIGTCNDQFPYVDTTNSKYAGGIVGFGEENNYLGSQSDFGALAMGLIPGTDNGSPSVGFFSGSPYPLTPDSSPKPIFANTAAVRNATNRGGYLSGNAMGGFDCTKDYFDDTQSNNVDKNSNSLQTDINNCGVGNKCQDYYTNGDMTISGACLPGLPAGNCPSIPSPNGISNQVTLYVHGNVNITGNITYPKIFDANDPSHMPYLTIIAKGNIILGPGVTELDGLYIAQPSGSGDGVFATCNNGVSVCNNQLVVNGAVIAQQIQLLRMHGTLHQPPNDVNGVGDNPAEIFNFVPSMVIGSPAFPSSPGQSSGVYTLPPVF